MIVLLFTKSPHEQNFIVLLLIILLKPHNTQKHIKHVKPSIVSPLSCIAPTSINTIKWDLAIPFLSTQTQHTIKKTDTLCLLLNLNIAVRGPAHHQNPLSISRLPSLHNRTHDNPLRHIRNKATQYHDLRNPPITTKYSHRHPPNLPPHTATP